MFSHSRQLLQPLLIIIGVIWVFYASIFFYHVATVVNKEIDNYSNRIQPIKKPSQISLQPGKKEDEFLIWSKLEVFRDTEGLEITDTEKKVDELLNKYAEDIEYLGFATCACDLGYINMGFLSSKNVDFLEIYSLKDYLTRFYATYTYYEESLLSGKVQYSQFETETYKKIKESYNEFAVVLGLQVFE